MTGIEEIVGKFWFSKQQQRLRDGRGDARIYCFIPNENKIFEYTEMAPVDVLLEEPNYVPIYPDAVYLGEGWYVSREQ